MAFSWRVGGGLAGAANLQGELESESEDTRVGWFSLRRTASVQFRYPYFLLHDTEYNEYLPFFAIFDVGALSRPTEVKRFPDNVSIHAMTQGLGGGLWDH